MQFIYTSTSNYNYIGTFKIGDCFIDAENDLMIVTDIDDDDDTIACLSLDDGRVYSMNPYWHGRLVDSFIVSK